MVCPPLGLLGVPRRHQTQPAPAGRVLGPFVVLAGAYGSRGLWVGMADVPRIEHDPGLYPLNLMNSISFKGLGLVWPDGYQS